LTRSLLQIIPVIIALSLAACAAPRDETGETGAGEITVPVVTTPAARPRAHSKPGANRPPVAIVPIPERRSAAPDETVDDVLERLRAGYGLPRADHDTVTRQAEWFASNPRYLERVFERARPYLLHVADELEARELPAELAFLPVIESAFDPFAYSHGRAAGLWQFTPATGSRFGLRQNWWYDGRRDVVESTRAALDYLEYLHKMFDGDWLLAVAAYNCGEGTVGRAVRANRESGKPTDFWSLRLPAETRQYVPRLLGLAAALAQPDPALSLPVIPNTMVFTTVELDGQIDLAVAAALAGIELSELQALNPGFNRWATDPEGPHRLQLPVETVDTFRIALEALPAAERVRWHRHQVRAGDTLGAIARQYHTTVNVLQSANNLSGTNIRVGSHLLVPTSSRSLADYPLSADNRLANTQQRERSGRVRSVHTVQSGESLWAIARRHGVGVRELAAWNGMAPGDTLSVGRKLSLWQPAGTASAAQRTASARAAPVRRVNYTVRRGDSLYRIANQFRVTIDDITRWNNLDAKRHLQPGQRLVLHVDVTAQSGG
jgi:membrane-bound lytic murein transglycosylase D